MAGFFVTLFILFISLSVFICSVEYKKTWGRFIAEAVKLIWAGQFIHILFINMLKAPVYRHWIFMAVLSVSGGILFSYILIKYNKCRILICALLLGLFPLAGAGVSEALLFFIFICLIVAGKSADIYLEKRNFVSAVTAEFAVPILALSAIFKYAAYEYFEYSGFFYGMAVYFCLNTVLLNSKRINLWQGVWLATGFAFGLSFY